MVPNDEVASLGTPSSQAWCKPTTSRSQEILMSG